MGKALLAWAASEDAAVAGAARRALLDAPRPSARALYGSWLAADAGKGPVAAILNAILVTSGQVSDKASGGARGEMPAGVSAEVLGRVMAAPESVKEYRLAFALLRGLAGRPVSKVLLDAEGLLLRAGSRGAEAAKAEEQVAGGVQVILSCGDPEAAAVVGLSLAMIRLKGGHPRVSDAGIAVLRKLPGKAGEKLVTHLARALRGTDLLLVQKVAAEVRGPDSR